MKKKLFKKDSSRLTKDSNKNSLFTYKNEQEKKDDSISFSSEDIEEKMNRLIQLKKLEKKNLIKNIPSFETKNKILMRKEEKVGKMFGYIEKIIYFCSR